MLFFLAEPPLQIILSLLLALVLFGFESWSQLLLQLEEFLRGERKTAALTNVTFRTGYIL